MPLRSHQRETPATDELACLLAWFSLASIQFSPLASPEFEIGRPTESQVELGRVVERGLRESRCAQATACVSLSLSLSLTHSRTRWLAGWLVGWR